jgi:hypothetical protein
MAVKNFYVLSSLAGTSAFQGLQEDGSAPSAAVTSPNTGWAAGTTGTGNSSEINAQTKRGTATFTSQSSSPKPTVPDNTNGNGFRTPNALSGDFPSGNWTLSIGVRSATAAYTGRFRFRWRVFRSANADASGYTEITSSTVVSSATTADLSTTTTTQVSVTWAAPAFVLSGEYLFFLLTAEVTSAGSGSTQDIILWVGSNSAVTTTDFTVAYQAVLATTQTRYTFY